MRPADSIEAPSVNFSSFPIRANPRFRLLSPPLRGFWRNLDRRNWHGGRSTYAQTAKKLSDPGGHPMTSIPPEWGSHAWANRRLELYGILFVQHFCRNCGRNFIDEPHTHRRHAVHIAATRFDKLSDEITAKWLRESCPRARLERDVADLGTRYFLD